MLTGVILLMGCKKDAVLTYLEEVPFSGTLEVSTDNVVLSTDNNDLSVITFSWPAVTFKIKAPVSYKLQLSLPADTIGNGSWSRAANIELGNDVLLKSFTGAELNTIALTKLGLEEDKVGAALILP